MTLPKTMRLAGSTRLKRSRMVVPGDWSRL